MEAAREELVPRVEAGQLGVVHEDVLFPKAEAAGVCARFEGLAAGQDPPLDGVVEALLLELPDVPAELGVFSLGRILEVRLVFAEPGLKIFSNTKVR